MTKNDDKIKPDDYARLHIDYHEDTDLEIIADQLADEYDAAILIWAYWPRMIGAAKKAKSFGWFRTTPKLLAQSIDDPAMTAWAPRARMWELLAEHGRIVVRQGAVAGPSHRIDVLPVNWDEWQATTAKERQRLLRERRRVAAGHAPHWTVAHLPEFRDAVTTQEDAACDNETEPGPPVTQIRNGVTETRGSVATREERREEETREDVAPTPVVPATPIGALKSPGGSGSDPLQQLDKETSDAITDRIRTQLATIFQDPTDADTVAIQIRTVKCRQAIRISPASPERRVLPLEAWERAVTVLVRDVHKGKKITGDVLALLTVMVPTYEQPGSERETVVREFSAVQEAREVTAEQIFAEAERRAVEAQAAGGAA